MTTLRRENLISSPFFELLLLPSSQNLKLLHWSCPSCFFTNLEKFIISYERFNRFSYSQFVSDVFIHLVSLSPKWLWPPYPNLQFRSYLQEHTNTGQVLNLHSDNIFWSFSRQTWSKAWTPIGCPQRKKKEQRKAHASCRKQKRKETKAPISCAFPRDSCDHCVDRSPFCRWSA